MAAPTFIPSDWNVDSWTNNYDTLTDAASETSSVTLSKRQTQVITGLNCNDPNLDTKYDATKAHKSSILSKKYACMVCGKEFNDKAKHRRHYMIHTGEKPFACSYCPYRANQSEHLKFHINFKHKPSK